MAYEAKDELEGAMWIVRDDSGQPKKDKNGHAYFDVKLTVRGFEFKAKAFKQDNEPGSRRPDYRIVMSKTGEGGQRSAAPAPAGSNIPF